MSTQEKELEAIIQSNDNIKATVTRLPHCQVKFDILVSPQATQAAFNRSLKNIKKEVSIPGFRKGKAPDQFILEKYKEQVHKEWVDIVLQTGFNEAVQLTHIHPLKDGHVKRPVVHECSKEKGASFTIECENRPSIPTIDLTNLRIRKIELAPTTQAQRDKALDQIVYQFTTYDPIQDQPVAKDNFVDLDVDIIEDIPKRIISNQRTQVNEQGLPFWLLQKVIGLRAGESVEGQTEPDPSNSDSDTYIQSHPILFHLTVNAIWEGHKPALDDELAKKVGLQSLEELKNKIEERLEQEALEEAFQKQIRELERFLIEHYPIDLPQSMIDADKKARLDRYIDQLKSKQQLSYLETHRTRIEEMAEKHAIENLQLYLLLRKTAADHHIEVSNEDISQELTQQIALLSAGRNSVDFQDRENIHHRIHSLALDHKIKRFLLDKATFIEG